MPLKAVIRGFHWTVIPITWRNRRTGMAKLKIKEMGSRYFFSCMYVWLEKYFSRGDYRQRVRSTRAPVAKVMTENIDNHGCPNYR